MSSDKHEAQTFRLLYRPQDDPLLHNEDAGERALFPASQKGSSSKSGPNAEGLHIADLENEIDLDNMRENEGEAAEHGIYYDDTEYDYMQHLREIGEGSGEAHFVDAAPVKVVGKGKGKARTMKLEDALQNISLEDASISVRNEDSVDESVSTLSRTGRPTTYQNQQEVPDEIAGFQPDMDPRLREVLEALEDDAYVDEKDEDDIFGALVNDGHNGELDLVEFEATLEDEDGWESDVTEKASSQPKGLSSPVETDGSLEPGTVVISQSATDPAAAAAEDGDWLRDFAKFKRDSAKQRQPKAAESIIAASAVQDQTPSLHTLNGTPLRRKKRKGALTNPSAYSMTSSSLARTEGQQLLDARFDQVEKMYTLDEVEDLEDDEDGGMSIASGLSKQSRMSTLSTASFADQGAVRQDFEGLMDGFLSGWNRGNPAEGKRKGAKGKRGKNGNEVFGLRQLDEVRAELGPARIYNRAQKA